ncbi:hypothetical protein DACRYDRAFT_85886 [Dacryopinax primogenitus]|uniref:Exonuclease domain-containing protein n=1 Tax=Dacryopinax primogenitus (strain DJM 731) TaxID=1858805 RepID=M5G721_DACPD|nr:uncharacterized protein DACRYDRAFT_85886 [Dacryopinax primogenitus]EJU06041.1 hypothetical protein DACRYDRAFT_85886 [Dacryopinax primogenitus]
MFKPLGLFSTIQCPQRKTCHRRPCPFSHEDPILTQHRASSSTVPATSSTPTKDRVVQKNSSPIPTPDRERLVNRKASPIPATDTPNVIPAKRHVDPLRGAEDERPRKFKAVAAPVASTSTYGTVTPRKTIPVSVPVPISEATTGPPVLAINAANSRIPMKDRQVMVSRLWEEFTKLYALIRPGPAPELAREHALKQEADVYDKTNKMTYRNAIITTIAVLKKRIAPTTSSHPSVGTEAQVAARLREQQSISALLVTANDLELAVLSKEDMLKWEYVVDAPEGPGGDRVADEGLTKTCERCGTEFAVHGEGFDSAECKFHWARPRMQKVPGGKKEKFYACCQSSDSREGCQLGAHVFRELSTEDLHARHPFTPTAPFAADKGKGTMLDVVALDCEMIYTTQGMSCARVTVVDAGGNEVLDELVRLDEGVKPLDYNTRFSGIRSLQNAVLDLEGVRAALSHIIGPETIIIGHALENDLKTMRMLHYRVVDTAVVFPHHHGAPIRHALRELVKVHLGQLIQTAGAEGHSSAEDATAALNLVKFWVKREREKKTAGLSTSTAPAVVVKKSEDVEMNASNASGINGTVS